MIKWPEIQYVEAEDGMLDPVLEFPKQPEGNIGKYGNMRREYLTQHRKIIYGVSWGQCIYHYPSMRRSSWHE